MDDEKEQPDVDKRNVPEEPAESVDSGGTEQGERVEISRERRGRVVSVGDILKGSDLNTGTPTELRKVLNSLSGFQLNYPTNLSGQIAGLDILSGSLKSVAIKDIISPSALADLKAAELNFSKQVKGIFDSTEIIKSLGILSEMRHGIGKFLGQIDFPKFATSTYEFLTNTEDLRYSSNRSVWHYTSGWVLMQVLNNNLLWASAPQHLNDASEVKHGIGIIRGAFIRRMEALREEGRLSNHELGEIEDLMLLEVLDDGYIATVLKEIYYISASIDDDSLTLWRNYANGDGFAIGIDAGADLSADGFVLDPDDQGAESSKAVPPINGWYRVHYTDPKKRKFADEFVASAVEDIIRAKDSFPGKLVSELRKQALILASTMKHSAFMDEKEVRWMATNWMPADLGVDFVHYEYARNSIVPVLHIKTSSDAPKPLPLRGVRCSPVAPNGIEETIEGLLIQKGYMRASKNVKKSQQPFKG